MKQALSNLIFNNFWLKFFSIALATVIWLGIHYDIHNQFSISQIKMSVPVEIVIPPGDSRIFKITPSVVVVIAVGEKEAQKNIRVYVDLTNFRSKRSATEEVHADVPPEINILEINPATVAVEQTSP